MEITNKEIIWNGTYNTSTSTSNKQAYYLSHWGLGDNITSIGAINFLLEHYDTIYFMCRDIYKENVELIFLNKPVIAVPYVFDNNYKENCANIINNVDKNKYDILICGTHNDYLKSHITNQGLLKYEKNTKYTTHHNHIFAFYNDIGLDLSIYFEYFDIPSSDISIQYYNAIKEYKIVFLHTIGSNRYIDLSHIIQQYRNRDEYIIICADKNVYDQSHPKYNIAEKYVNIKIVYYIDLIKHASIIHIVNSCFECIVYPLLMMNRIQPEECKIYPGIGGW